MGPENSGRPPSWLSDAVDAVLADLQHPSPIEFVVSYRADVAVAVSIEGDASTTFEVDPEYRGAFLLERFADHVQEFLQETHAAWGEARPPCPGHTHPARPYEDEAADVAWWYCPLTNQDIARIGRYGETNDPA